MEKTNVLGKTGLNVGRLGLASSYGAPAKAFELAFEHGCNYFYMGGGGKKTEMKTAIKNLIAKGKRDEMVLAVQTYSRWGVLMPFLFKQTLASMGVKYADVLILGWHNSVPSGFLLDTAQKLKDQGLCRFIAMSGHKRSLFPILAKDDFFDIFHIRYNAAHRGAETDCFPLFNPGKKPGIVTYTATRWGHLLDPKKMPGNKKPLTADECYRFVMANSDIDVCLCGPRNMEEMRIALSALEGNPLNEKGINRIKTIGDFVRKKRFGFF